MFCSTRKIKWAGYVARMGKSRGACRVLAGNLRGTTLNGLGLGGGPC